MTVRLTSRKTSTARGSAATESSTRDRRREKLQATKAAAESTASAVAELDKQIETNSSESKYDRVVLADMLRREKDQELSTHSSSASSVDTETQQTADDQPRQDDSSSCVDGPPGPTANRTTTQGSAKSGDTK